ncbi:membrane protein [Microbacterium phage Necrophoxinus]|nr:hypothetical protein SEA_NECROPHOXINUS_3 [Microbacterium phage Necrophoxinus]QWS69480.1 membrane protein [Microbacterium phage Necrophoxinus]
MNRYLHALLCALALAVGLTVGSVASGLAHDAATLPPCATEDSTGCYWDASESGNGHGWDLVNP